MDRVRESLKRLNKIISGASDSNLFLFCVTDPTEYTVISQHLRRFGDFHHGMNMECSIFPAVQDLLANLTLPPELPSGGMQQMVILII